MFIPKKKANRNEADTRADHIDPRLEFHGWGKDWSRNIHLV